MRSIKLFNDEVIPKINNNKSKVKNPKSSEEVKTKASGNAYKIWRLIV